MAKSRRMKKDTLPNGQPYNYVYPTSTAGGRLAKVARAQASNLSEADRSSLFKQGMQVIYGGTGGKEKVGR